MGFLPRSASKLASSNSFEDNMIVSNKNMTYFGDVGIKTSNDISTTFYLFTTVGAVKLSTG